MQSQIPSNLFVVVVIVDDLEEKVAFTFLRCGYQEKIIESYNRNDKID